MTRAPLAAALVLLAASAPAARAQGVAPAYALAPMDREAFAGVSYRDLLAGGLIVAGSAVVAAALTGSALASATAAVAVAGGFLLVEPDASRFASKVDVPTLPELRRNPDRD